MGRRDGPGRVLGMIMMGEFTMNKDFPAKKRETSDSSLVASVFLN